MARELSKRGWRTHVVWRSSDPSELEERFPRRAHQADLTDESQTRGLVQKVLEIDGRLDAVVHAVGEYLSGPLEGASTASLRHLLESNTLSAFSLFTAARQSLRETHGAMVFFGTSGLETQPARKDAALYTASKTALLSLVRSLAKEEIGWGVRLNMVSPGLVPHEHASEDTKTLAQATPIGRACSDQDLAEAVAFLLSREGSQISGQNLDVAGGWGL